ncbi:hypothetical protein KTO58_06305 [Chitinophaga pendula]|uniref:MGH1-like glycoside hydrolase domain-containing protein n=1 Tax=Chitinophaga TaxID=79328 RepID=UPI0018DF22D6|nr:MULTISPECIES: trehalase family glycosidase [Chitinophaga]UCJ08800.1 hypothetical protein KTO58_06305 [Chitinophaga pendula]
MTALIGIGCLHAQAQQPDRQKFPDVLDIRHQVKDTNNTVAGFFADQGAWHAYALPAREEDNGAFVGPLIMDMQGRWLGHNTARLRIFENERELPMSAITVHYYPGILVQTWQLPGLQVNMQLLYSNKNTAVIQATIKNTAKQSRTLDLQWSANVLLATSYSRPAGDLLLQLQKGGHQLRIRYDTPTWQITTAKEGYSATKKISLPPGNTSRITQSQSYNADALQTPEHQQISSFTSLLRANQQRWNNYLQKGLKGVAPAQQRLGTKCIVTLLTNWRSATKGLHHDGVFPSASYQGFYGFWAWDSWKQAVALTRFHPQLAKDNIRAMFDFQDTAGMVPDCIYTDTTENNWRDTKPPLAAWAVNAVFRSTHDTAFVKEMYPLLEKYHHWWYANRDHDRDSLCEFGATDGTRIAAAWESGMDNAVRFDNARMLQNGPHAWSLDQASVDLNVYLYAEKNYLATLAAVLKQPAQHWHTQAAQLKQHIDRRFYDTETGFYYDRRLPGDSLVKVLGAEGWLPLWAGLSSKDQAQNIANILQQPTTFNTQVPLPVLSAAHPAFDPRRGYWRGPVWLDQFYFAVNGLQRYQLHAIADTFLHKLWTNAEGMQDSRPLYENYHPLTGKGLNAIHFSWSAAHVLLMLDKTSVE